MADPQTSESFCVVADAAEISIAQAREKATRQKGKITSTPPMHSPKSRLSELEAWPPPDDGAKHKHRQSPFRIRHRLSKVFDPILHPADTHK